MNASDICILVVEDDEFTRMATVAILKSCEYSCDSCENGKEALEILVKNNGIKHDLVLCDVMLPVMNGIEMLEKMQQDHRLCHIPVVMTSSNEEMDVVTSCLSKGAKDYLIKPVQVNTAKTLLRHVWLNRMQLQKKSPSQKKEEQQHQLQQKAIWRNMDIIRTIGKGTHGNVYLAKRKVDSAVVALKKVETSGISASGQKQADNEVILLKSLYHVNIVRFYDSFMNGQELNIVMEYANGGNLRQLVRMQVRERRGYFPESRIMSWFAQVVLAVAYIHGKNVLHRDLKSQNVFLTSKNVVKLGDFGISKALAGDGMANTSCGTPESMSPEICRGEPYGKKSDIWSLGCVLYEMMMLQRPFEADSLPVMFSKICLGDYAPVNDCFSRELRLLIQLMLQQDPVKRPTIEDICRFPFVQMPIQVFLSEHVAEFQEALALEAKLHDPATAKINNDSYHNKEEKKQELKTMKEQQQEQQHLSKDINSSSDTITLPSNLSTKPSSTTNNGLFDNALAAAVAGLSIQNQNEVVMPSSNSTAGSATLDRDSDIYLDFNNNNSPLPPSSSPLPHPTYTSSPSKGREDPTALSNSTCENWKDVLALGMRVVLNVGDRKLGLFGNHSNCFSGREFIDLLMRDDAFSTANCSILPSHKSKKECIQILEDLIEAQLLVIVVGGLNSSSNNNNSNHNQLSKKNIDYYSSRSLFRFQLDKDDIPLNTKYIWRKGESQLVVHQICKNISQKKSQKKNQKKSQKKSLGNRTPIEVALCCREYLAKLHRKNSKSMPSIKPQWSSSASNKSSDQSFSSSTEVVEMYFDLLRVVSELQAVDLDLLAKQERQCFFLNVYNTMSLHGVIELGPNRNSDQFKSMEKSVVYNIGGHLFSLGDIRHGILRRNRKAPYFLWGKQFENNDPRMQYMLHVRDPRSLFVLLDGSPIQRTEECVVLKPGSTYVDLEEETEKYVSRHVRIHPSIREIHLPRLFRLYRDDFGNSETEMLQWLVPYLDDDAPAEFIQYRVKYNHNGVL